MQTIQNNPPDFQLSENLYPVDEVIVSFIQSLITRRTLNECLFWLWELVYSIPNIVDGIKIIYWKFYYKTSTSLNKYIFNKLNLYESTKNISYLAAIITNLRTQTPTPEAFLLHYYFTDESNVPSHVFNLDKPTKINTKLKPHPREIKLLYLALQYGCLKSAAFYLRYTLSVLGYEKTYNYLIELSLWKQPDLLQPPIENKDIIYLCSICLKTVRKSIPSRNSFFIPVDKEKVDYLENLFKYWNVSLAERLIKNRLFATHNIVIPLANNFEYSRDLIRDSLNNHIIFNNPTNINTYMKDWIFYSMSANSWEKRCALFRHNDKFDIDNFNKHYILDFNKLPLEIQHKSIHDITIPKCPLDWFQSIHEQHLLSSVQELSMNESQLKLPKTISEIVPVTPIIQETVIQDNMEI